MPSPSEHPPTKHRTAGLILAAGASRRLGRPKQLLPYGPGVLLDAVLAAARGCGFDQTVLVLGGSAAGVQSMVDTTGCEVVLNPAFGGGCSSSIAAGAAALHPDTDTVVLLLGDQPGVRAENARALLELLVNGGAGSRPAPGIAVCRYDDGAGHPLAFTRRMLPELAALHGDKAVWKLLEQRPDDVVELRVPGPVPPDVDTEEDYRRVLAGREASL
ncbi:molybdenum cofactor cytidylyltransferase [Arthrobacter ginsengisoli]|uniref:Molybdenum cofactor cytidylyltransferase n=1 Tax=Arthrobacter ginsengisoli TaxID=1356565 RepID=A0ABU1UCH3_9MICC|nr:nucleotidyltransferase family protein [Arthrobacter ginsengisoli]MDR7082826.1 molybdenum cofactor cytidylyltransferase [Arthrobacter ginsengisoli]